jgi:hypothetical protein
VSSRIENVDVSDILTKTYSEELVSICGRYEGHVAAICANAGRVVLSYSFRSKSVNTDELQRASLSVKEVHMPSIWGYWRIVD